METRQTIFNNEYDALLSTQKQELEDLQNQLHDAMELDDIELMKSLLRQIKEVKRQQEIEKLNCVNEFASDMKIIGD